MPTADRILMLKLLGDTASIDKSLRGTQGRLRSTAAAAGSWMKAAGIGLAIEGVSQLTQALGDAWTGFREGEKASAQLATTWDNFNVKGADLQETIDAISASALKLGTDDTEAINAFNKALQATGGDSSAAMKRLRIAQDLVANGSAPNLSAAMKLIQQAGNGSKRVVDQFGLTAETAGGRIKQLGQKVKGAADKAADLDPLRVTLNRINEDLEGIVGSLSQGDLDGALASLRDIGTALSDVWTKVYPAVSGVLDSLSGGAFSEFVAWLSETGKPVMEKFTAVLDDMAYAWTQLQPVLSQVLTFIQPVIDLLATGIEGSLGFVLDAISGTLRTLGELLTGDFSAAWETAGDTIARLAADVQTIIDGVITFLQTALGDIGKTAGEIGSAIFDGIVDGVRRMAVAVANAWNAMGSFPAGGFTFAEAFDIEVMGQHIGWPKIALSWGAGDILPNISVPEFKDGGIVKARPGGLIGRIGEAGRDEAVIPLDRLGGMLGGADTVHHVVSGTVRLDITQGAAGALRAAGYTPADIAELSARLEHQNRMQSVAYARMAGED